MNVDNVVTIFQSLGPLLGVLLGSLISALVTMMNNRHAASIEDRKWKREDLLHRETAERMQRESRLDIYHKCIKSLSALATLGSDRDDEDKATRTQLWKEAIEHTTRLALLRTDIEGELRTQFHRYVEYLDRTISYTDELLRVVRKLALSDSQLSPNAVTIEAVAPNTTKVTIGVDVAFRKSIMVDSGKDIPESYTFTCSLEDLSTRQRELLWEVSSAGRIHSSIHLRIPQYREKEATKVRLDGAKWEATIDPTTSEPTAIFNAWEHDYEQALAAAKTAAGSLCRVDSAEAGEDDE